MNLFDYIHQDQPITIEKDNSYDKIISNWNEFIDCVSEEDKQLLLKIIGKCYYKYRESIKAIENSDYSLFTGLLMSILIDQQIQIDRLLSKNTL